ncbi:glycosyltransferase family 4 protein [Pediococcus stilesii]|uniref:Glycosyltransferase n=1 Tax=Pediococcus stilesii TaxID=331679 RepID=A0A0R2KVD1_9LACO|nr:glycosyltransferase [Pediococcus stilesii]KRN93470.1 glycosyltransferase [Pediococcus stilesii]
MIFFINAQMPEKKSGIEHAQIKRINLFKKMKQDARIILRDWNSETHRLTKLVGIEDDDFISMFDYYQEAMHVKRQIIKPADLDFGVPDLKLVSDLDHRRYLAETAEGQLVARINIDLNDDRVLSTELFDGFGNLYRVDQYDYRGFVSLSQWYTPDNQIGTEEWKTPSGRTAIEAFSRQNMRGEMKQSGWKLTTTTGQVYQFDTIEELTKHFFDDLNDEFWSVEEPNIFILDRDHLGDWALLNMEKPAYRVIHLHNSHASDAQNPMKSTLNQHYEYALNSMNRYDAFISATKKQTKDVKARLKPQIKMFTIPVGIVPDQLLNAPRIPVEDRQFGKIVAFARIAWEKHLDDLVRAVAIVHKTVPAVSLDLYGYADGSNNYEAKRLVEQVIKEEHLEDVVKFKGYTTDVDAVENNAMMFGLTSRMEGFNLAVMEGIAHGLISFSYDVNYGPNEIVENDVNGNVVPYGDYEALAGAMIKVLQDPKLAQKYSTGAYDSAERYSDANVWKAWKRLLRDAKASWPAKLAAMPENREVHK